MEKQNDFFAALLKYIISAYDSLAWWYWVFYDDGVYEFRIILLKFIERELNYISAWKYQVFMAEFKIPRFSIDMNLSDLANALHHTSDRG